MLTHSSHRTIGKAMIIIFGIAFAVIIGLKMVKFADKYVENTQNRINNAFDVLENK